MNNDVMFCPTSSASCYYHQAAGVNNANAVTACTTMGGRLVSWNTEDEQLQVGESMPAGCNRLQQMNQRVYPYVTGDQGSAKEVLDALAADWKATFAKYGRGK